MAAGLMYLRPRQVVCYRAYGPFKRSSPTAWNYVFSWLDRNGVRAEVEHGFGLAGINPAQRGDRSRWYDACVELPACVDLSELEDMWVRDMPGGAFARTRYVGAFSGLGNAIRELRDTWVASRGLEIDPARPIVEIFLDDPKQVSAENMRVDLCLPVRAAATAAKVA